MRGYVQVRFYERLGGQFPRSTRLILLGGHITDAISNQLEGILTRMGLRLNKEKTSRKQLWKEPMDFLGFTIRWARTPYKGSVNRFWNIHPSVKSEKKLRQSIREIVRMGLHSKPGVYVYKLNVKLRGWINYYQIKGVTQLYTSISRVAGYLGQTIYRMYRRKSQNGWSRRYRQCAYKKFIAEYGLIDLYKCVNRKAL